MTIYIYFIASWYMQATNKCYSTLFNKGGSSSQFGGTLLLECTEADVSLLFCSGRLSVLELWEWWWFESKKGKFITLNYIKKK